MMELQLRSEAWICQGCGKCTGVCPVARSGLGYSPRRLLQQAVQEGTDACLSDRALFACLACDRCTRVCKSGISVSGIMQELRALARERGISGRPAHAGILQSLMHMMADAKAPQDRLRWLDSSVRTSPDSDTVYFVGCAPYFAPVFRNLGVRPLSTARNAIRLLNHAGTEPRLLPDERCCGHDLLWQGDVAGFRKLAEHNLSQLREAGARTVVFSCPECLRTFKLDYPRHFGPLDFEVLHIAQLLARDGIASDSSSLETRAVYHDPCRLGRHLGIYDAPRQLLKSIRGLELLEMDHSRELANCCGGNCWTECGAAVKSLQSRLLDEAAATGADRLVTACPKCDIHLNCAVAAGRADTAPARRTSEVGSEVVAAPRITNLVDLLAESLGIADAAEVESTAGPTRKGGGPNAE
jgi:Fe-S oxidoreductase